MSANREVEERNADVLEGCAALLRALAIIGEPGMTDQDMARVIVEGELKLRALVTFCATAVCEGRLA